MAKVIRRVWTGRGPTGRRVRHVAWGYQIAFIGSDGKRHRERRVSREWLSEQDALAALVARQREIEAGQVTRPKQRTLGQVVDEYLAHKANEKKRSVDDDELILKRKILPAFGAETPLRKITREDIARFTKARLEQEVRPGHKVKAGTVANELSVFRHLLRLAQEWGYVAEVPKVKLPKRSEGRLRYLQSDEIARLLEACPESRNPHLRTIVVLALNTGMRRGEILGLEWELVDLATARITLYRTKSGKPRGIPINTAVYDALIALEPDPAHRVGRLFKKANGAGWDRIRTAFELGLRRAKIQDFRFHDLRHTFASHAVMRGVSLAELKELLGHSTLTMTLRYAHLSPTHLRGAVARLDGLTSAPTTAPRAHERAHDAILGGPLQGSTRNVDTGGVAERLKAPVLKTGMGASPRGFESLPLRHPSRSGPLS